MILILSPQTLNLMCMFTLPKAVVSRSLLDKVCISRGGLARGRFEASVFKSSYFQNKSEKVHYPSTLDKMALLLFLGCTSH